MHSHPAPLIAASLALTDVDARSDPYTTRGERRDQIQRTPNRLGRPVEEREDSVSRVLRTVAAMLLQKPVDDLVMCIELLTPVSIAGRAELFRGTDYVGEKNRLENTFICRSADFLEDELETGGDDFGNDVESIVRA